MYECVRTVLSEAPSRSIFPADARRQEESQRGFTRAAVEPLPAAGAFLICFSALVLFCLPLAIRHSPALSTAEGSLATAFARLCVLRGEWIFRLTRCLLLANVSTIVFPGENNMPRLGPTKLRLRCFRPTGLFASRYAKSSWGGGGGVKLRTLKAELRTYSKNL